MHLLNPEKRFGCVPSTRYEHKKRWRGNISVFYELSLVDRQEGAAHVNSPHEEPLWKQPIETGTPHGKSIQHFAREASGL